MTQPYAADHSHWLTIEQAIHAYQLSERTIRRRLKTREIAAEMIDTPYGKAWRIRPPQRAPSNATPSQQPDNSQVGLVPFETIRDALAPLQQALDHLVNERDDLRRQLDEAQQARLVDREEIGRLRGRLEAAEQQQQTQQSALKPERKRRWFWQRS